MVVNPLKVFLFLAGGTVAAGATAYVSGALDPYIYDQGAVAVAELPAPAPSDPAAPKGERLPDAETPPATAARRLHLAADATRRRRLSRRQRWQPSRRQPMTRQHRHRRNGRRAAGRLPAARRRRRAAGRRWRADLRRRARRGDGSVVVAGKAAPDALVEMLNGATVLGDRRPVPRAISPSFSTMPLKPGDYQITLRATPPATLVTSVQTAVLSIPEKPGGQVLAMVEEPGKPSELLTVPQPETSLPRPAAGDQAASAGHAAAPTPAAPKVGTQAPATPAAVAAVTPAAGPAATARRLQRRPNSRSWSRRSRSKATRSSSPARRIPAARSAPMPTRSCLARRKVSRTAISWSRPSATCRSAATSSVPTCSIPMASR